MTRLCNLALAWALPLLLLSAGCSGTTLRKSSLERVSLEGHDITVSWIWLGDEAVDVAVYEDALWQGQPTPGTPRLTAQLARKAADRVMGWRCLFFGPVHQAPLTSAGNNSYGFRYDCSGRKGEGS